MVLPDHEHVLIEQTYVLEGSLAKRGWMRVWRPAGSRHVAYWPNGATMIGIFQVPNKFFEVDGRATDASGRDWDEAWKHVLALS